MILEYQEVLKRLLDNPNDPHLLQLASREIERRQNKPISSLAPYLPIEYIIEKLKESSTWKRLKQEHGDMKFQCTLYSKNLVTCVERYEFTFQSSIFMKGSEGIRDRENFPLEIDLLENNVNVFIPYWETRGGKGRASFLRSLKMSDTVLRYTEDWIGFFQRIIARLEEYDDYTHSLW
jgi:hypothetical protein